MLTALVLAALPILGQDEPSRDWLLAERPYEARVTVSADGRELVMENGLIRRVWRLEPNAACVAFDDLMSGRSLLRAVRPEARVTIDGVERDVGGLEGQPNHAFLTDAARLCHESGTAVEVALRRDSSVDLEVTVPAGGMTWYVIE